MEEREDVGPVLASARRQVKASLNTDELPLLKQSARDAETIGKKMGVTSKTEIGFTPHLDVRRVSISGSILALHDGPIPMRQSGLGTSRLLSIGLQYEASREGGVTLVDEIESGLEPHRLRRLLHVLRSSVCLRDHLDPNNEDDDATVAENTNQIIITTHSPVALSELEPADLRVVRANNGCIAIEQPDDVLRPLLRTNPDAFFGPEGYCM
jgi:putative ATP-dependent endonuclease of OLD family